MISSIVERELRAATRRPATYWLRAVLAAFAFVMCIQWFGGNLIALKPAMVGHETFKMLSLLGFVVACSASIITADSVSAERREGTLGLLFLTSLKSRDVVFGKFAVCGFVALCALLGFAPALMLSLVVGGVTGGEVVRMALLLVNVLFLSLAVGLFASTRAAHQVAAIFTAFGVLAVIAIGPFVPAMLAHFWLPIDLSMLSPISGYLAAGDVQYPTQTVIFWTALISTHIGAWLMLALATIALGRNWRRVHLSRALPPPPPKERRLTGAPRVILHDRANRRRAFAPVARAVLRMRGQRALAWFAALVSVGGSVWHAVAMNRLGSTAAAASVALIFKIMTSALFALVAGRFFLEARRSGELELLLVTPVGARGILREQRLAVLRLLMGPIYLVFFGTVLVALGDFRLHPDNAFQAVFLNLCNMADAVLGVLAVGRVAMWFGTRVNNPFALMGCAVGLVIVAPVAVAYVASFLFLGVSHALESRALLIALFFVFKDLFFIRWSGKRLQREFRTKDSALLDRLFGWVSMPRNICKQLTECFPSAR